MAQFQMFEVFSEDVARGVHQFHAAGHTIRAYLTNNAPNAATHEGAGDIAGIAAGNGYAGPMDTQNDISRAGAVTTVSGETVTVTADGGEVGPFRYAVLFNDDPTGDPLIGYWDYESAVTLQNNESFQIQFPNGLHIFRPPTP